MRYLSPPTLARSEQTALLQATACHCRDHLLFSLALGTGLHLAKIVGLNMGDVFSPGSGRAGDVFLPDVLVSKLEAMRSYKIQVGESLAPDAPLFCNQL